MAHLVIYRGLPASGKSTHANGKVMEDVTNRVRVNRDLLREMMHAGHFEKGVTEQFIIIARNTLIEKFLKKGMTVYCDDTNLPKRTVSELIKIANKVGATWEIEDLTHVTPYVCVFRNLNRQTRVNSEDIWDMYNRYLRGKVPPTFDALVQPAANFETYRQPGGPLAFIVDIDGTVAKMDGRSPYDYTKVLEDKPNYPVLDTIRSLYNEGHVILFTSGRPDSCREDTETWMRIHAAGMDHKLFMRETGDTRADWIVKLELFNKFIRYEYDVQAVFDDRNQVVEMWRRLGLTCMQVAEGDF